DIILRMIEEKVDAMVDVGPQKQMMGLAARIVPGGSNIAITSIEGVQSLNEFLDMSR
ncbi:MAG: hypothetical protein GX846_11410, partial [Deltaproteobacteria bacterium]|nr:hypothetical protein [Deltaproteobacteria bacterium]